MRRKIFAKARVEVLNQRASSRGTIRYRKWHERTLRYNSPTVGCEGGFLTRTSKVKRESFAQAILLEPKAHNSDNRKHKEPEHAQAERGFPTSLGKKGRLAFTGRVLSGLFGSSPEVYEKIRATRNCPNESIQRRVCLNSREGCEIAEKVTRNFFTGNQREFPKGRKGPQLGKGKNPDKSPY